MESQGILDPVDKQDLYALHYVFLPCISLLVLSKKDGITMAFEQNTFTILDWLHWIFLNRCQRITVLLKMVLLLTKAHLKVYPFHEVQLNYVKSSFSGYKT